MFVKTRFDVAGIGGKQQRPTANSNQVRRLAAYIQIRMLTQERQRGDRAVVESQALHLIQLDHVPAADVLENQLQRRVLQESARARRHNKVLHLVSDLQQGLE